jgi:hypothetical protein
LAVAADDERREVAPPGIGEGGLIGWESGGGRMEKGEGREGKARPCLNFFEP